jgi:hypothetical protein
MFAELDATYAERNARSPALALGAVIGIGDIDELWFDFGTSSTAVNSRHASIVQGSVRVDSRTPDWFGVWIAKAGASGFSGHGADTEPIADHLGLGPCIPAELPTWLARASATLGIEWMPFAPRTNLRGKKRARLDAWLAGE